MSLRPVIIIMIIDVEGRWTSIPIGCECTHMNLQIFHESRVYNRFYIDLLGEKPVCHPDISSLISKEEFRLSKSLNMAILLPLSNVHLMELVLITSLPDVHKMLGRNYLTIQ